MIQFRSVLWFLLRNFRNNIIFFTGNLLILSLQYMILNIQYEQIMTYQAPWFPIFIAIILISIFYNFLFYLSQSGRIGLLLLYGITKLELYLIILLENMMILILAMLLNLFMFTVFDLKSLLSMLLIIAFISLVSSIKYFFTDIYKIVRE